MPYPGTREKALKLSDLTKAGLLSEITRLRHLGREASSLEILALEVMEDAPAQM